MLWGRLDGRPVWGRMNTCICMAESFCCPPDTITTLLIGYTPIKDDRIKFKIDFRFLEKKYTKLCLCSRWKNSKCKGPETGVYQGAGQTLRGHLAGTGMWRVIGDKFRW